MRGQEITLPDFLIHRSAAAACIVTQRTRLMITTKKILNEEKNEGRLENQTYSTWEPTI